MSIAEQELLETLAPEETVTHETSLIAYYATILSTAEFGLGSMLHALHAPCVGYLLSLNQIFILTKAASSSITKCSLSMPCSISTVVAFLKSLAPIGKKLMPMLAITMQGILYSMGLFLGGNNAFGRVLGAVSASLWGFLQPFLLYYFIFGEALLQTAAILSQNFSMYLGLSSNLLVVAIIGWICLKVCFAVLIALFAPSIGENDFNNYLQKIFQIKRKIRPQLACPTQKVSTVGYIIIACGDMCRPFFIFSVVLTALFFYFSDQSPNWLVWGVLRPVAVGFISFFLIRRIPWEKLLKRWKKNNQASPISDAFTITLGNIYKDEAEDKPWK